MATTKLVPRYVNGPVVQFAEDRFVLLSGPRQVGKTTVARKWLEELGGGKYLNWDIPGGSRANPAARVP